MTRTTRKDLDALAEAIDRALDLPDGTHHIQGWYGRHQLMADGGARDVSPNLPMGELREWLRAYKRGIHDGRRALIALVRTRPVSAFDDYGYAVDRPAE